MSDRFLPKHKPDETHRGLSVGQSRMVRRGLDHLLRSAMPSGNEPESCMYKGNPGATGVFSGVGPDLIVVPLWTEETSSGEFSTPAIHGKRLVIVSQNEVRCLDLHTGQRLWTFLDSRYVHTPASVSPICIAGLVLVPSENGCYALDLRSGRLVWRGPASHDWRLVANKSVVLANTAEGIIEIDLYSGRRLRTLSAIPALRPQTDIFGDVIPGFSSDNVLWREGVLICVDDYGIAVMNLHDNDVSWLSMKEDGVGHKSILAVDDECVVIRTSTYDFQKQLYHVVLCSYEMASGDKLWSSTSDLRQAVHWKEHVVAADNEALYYLDPLSGEIVTFENSRFSYVSYLAASRDYVLACGQARDSEHWLISAINPEDRDSCWDLSLPDRPTKEPLTANGVAVVSVGQYSGSDDTDLIIGYGTW